ncbi:MAG: hypothetical protein K1X74_14850 [Pirellulales bacterium]|nr:hypothetical protein [Pirellulales bacterium]
MAQPTAQLEIDFLPARYREQHRKRTLNLWRVIVVSMATALLVVGAGHQWSIRWQMQWELQAAHERYESQRAVSDQLGKLQESLHAAESRAQLLTFLDHPWPQSQLLSAALAPVPADMQVTSLHMVHEAVVPSAAESALPAVDPLAGTPEVEESPWVNDLRTLQKECGAMQVCLIIEGTVVSAAEVQAYLRGVRESQLIAGAEMQALETDAEGTTRFRVRLRIRPGLGIPGGPAVTVDAPLAKAGNP